MPDRLSSNIRAAGAENRLEIRPGDLREMPFEAGSFDAAASGCDRSLEPKREGTIACRNGARAPENRCSLTLLTYVRLEANQDLNGG